MRMNKIQNNKQYALLLWELLLWLPQATLRYPVWEGFLLLGVEGKERGKQFWRQDMCLCCISFLEPLDGNICLLTPTPTHKHTIGLLHSCTLRKWILSVRIRGFPGGEVHGRDKEFGRSRNADADSGRAGQGYSSSPEDPLWVFLSVHACMCLHVHIWLCVCVQVFHV